MSTGIRCYGDATIMMTSYCGVAAALAALMVCYWHCIIGIIVMVKI